MPRPSSFWNAAVAALLLVMATGSASAQQTESVNGMQFPLNQWTPPGTISEWQRLAGRIQPGYLQPVLVKLPTSGQVTFYQGYQQPELTLAAPGQAKLSVGSIYRLRISDLPELPGVEIYPSIELIDRLHPPAGQLDRFPVVIDLLEDELAWAADGRLVTKVIYLEQPDRVALSGIEREQNVITMRPNQNLVAEADSLGRPIAIVRLGGRLPDLLNPDPQFFGPGGPVELSQPEPLTPESARRSSTNAVQTAGHGAAATPLDSRSLPPGQRSATQPQRIRLTSATAPRAQDSPAGMDSTKTAAEGAGRPRSPRTMGTPPRTIRVGGARPTTTHHAN